MTQRAQVQTSWASSPAIRRSMQSNRSRDTGPEMALRRMLHAQGFRYRVCARPLPEVRHSVDIVFRKSKVAVQVNGCFWHGCPQHYRAPSRNRDYWTAKIERNQARDSHLSQILTAAGWLLVVVWEHDNVEAAAVSIAAAVSSRRAPP
ncbi:very short patch repair endonuclease [Mycobacterium intracellulare]|uniref:very short patch repair endonuclease n=1 Tax=Mycobacterium intracellulare TaxID=1767 RepID=UPI000BAF2A4F|nr:very short patch repair endonuclease [Mycobacterium intracellulare]PBA56421.1 very short patch repair endonuclease [Mycobacterium intracellulare subsp. chimaera]